MIDHTGPVLSLGDDAASLDTVGGKGASLARLVRAGLPVPAGFHVTTAAYLDFVARDGRHEAILDAVDEVDPDEPGSFEAAAERVRTLFAEPELPPATAAAVAKAYADLGGPDLVVAVRSSATAEDLPDMSFAGQQDTYLGVRGEAAVLDAVQRCWASLWTPRAIGYRARNGIPQADVSLAVVVQELVPADAAGILFTVDPVSGDRDRIVVNAGWGLGEAVVGGAVTPDTAVVDRASGAIVDYRVATKEVMTVRDDYGTHEVAVAPDLRDLAVLTDEQAKRLAELGVGIEELYGRPMDVEWVRTGDELYVVQARPVTNLVDDVQPTEEWNASLDGDYLWSNGNLGEAIPDVMTPITWSFVKIFMSKAMATSSLPGYRGYGRIGGRFYMNLSMAASLAGAVGVSGARFRRLTEPVFGKLPADMSIPQVPLPRWRIVRMLLPVTIAVLRDVRRFKAKVPGFVATAVVRSEQLRAEVGDVTDRGELVELWRLKIEPYFAESCMMLSAGARQGVTALMAAPAKLRDLVGETDANAILSGQRDGDDLASLGPILGLARLARGEIDRATFARQYGHRSAHEFEVSAARPGEDPRWVDEQLADLARQPSGVDDLLARQREAREAAWQRLAQRYPRKVAKLRRQVAQWAEVARARELTRSEVIRAFWVLRAWVLRAGAVTGHGEDVFFLTIEELLDVLGGNDEALAVVPRRRATYEKYRALPPYPTLIRGRFDPMRWAADPNRRSDLFDEHGGQPAVSDTVTGFAGSAGVVEGTARVVPTVEEAGRLGTGEILVTTVTNIGWTPVFPRAAAVVTDVGAPLSHAAIVARELGIPAVVGCGNATMRLADGARVRVDGEHGTVEVLEPVPVS